jgi:hypothetical protein
VCVCVCVCVYARDCMSSLHQKHVFRRVPHRTHAYGPILMACLKNMATSRQMHVVPIFMQIQKLWKVLRVSIACAQILNDIFVPTSYTQKKDG